MSRPTRLVAVAAIAVALAQVPAGVASAQPKPRIYPAGTPGQVKAAGKHKPSAKQRARMRQTRAALKRSAQVRHDARVQDMVITQPVGTIAVWQGCSYFGSLAICTWEYQSYGYTVASESTWWEWNGTAGQWDYLFTSRA
jgi:hypothetical protein